MREMKDSGIEWIGEIPVEWNLVKTKRFFTNTKKIVGTEADKYDRLALTLNGVIKRSKDDSEGLQPEKFEGYQILCKNELVFKLIDLENVKTSRVGLSPYTGLVSPAYIVLSNNFEDNRFFYYWFMFMYYNKVFNHLGGEGVRSALNSKDVLSLLVPDIRFDEQCRIADYLDRKCNQIDAIIARQQEVIEKLKAYKLSVITEAVTKGLNPDVPMKDSGVEWIGEIPEHWTVSVLRYGLDNIQTGPFGSQLHAEDYIEDGIFVINPANIVEGCIVPDNRCSVTESKAQELSRHILDKGDIVFARRGEMGRCACFSGCSKQYLCGTGCIKIRCNANLMPEFISWFLQTSCVKQYLTLNSVGTTMANLNTTIISGIPVVYPPMSEQERIVKYIKNKIYEIDDALKNKLSIVDKFTEYKKSLIYEVVTGKKEV